MSHKLCAISVNIVDTKTISYEVSEYKCSAELYEYELLYADSLIAQKLKLSGFVRPNHMQI